LNVGIVTESTLPGVGEAVAEPSVGAVVVAEGGVGAVVAVVGANVTGKLGAVVVVGVGTWVEKPRVGVPVETDAEGGGVLKPRVGAGVVRGVVGEGVGGGVLRLRLGSGVGLTGLSVGLGGIVLFTRDGRGVRGFIVGLAFFDLDFDLDLDPLDLEPLELFDFDPLLPIFLVGLMFPMPSILGLIVGLGVGLGVRICDFDPLLLLPLLEPLDPLELEPLPLCFSSVTTSGVSESSVATNGR
jgi:hypothetical protein